MTSNVSASQIANDLAAKVHGGSLIAGGMYPSERELCEQYGVGRNVVRESFTILQGMSLADNTKGKRPRVNTPSLGQVMEGISESAGFFFSGSEGKAHLEQARLFLETSMLRYSVIHATNAQIAKMVEAIEECEKSYENVAAFRIADVKFHRALSEVPGNPIFVALHETFVEQLMQNRPVLDNPAERNKASNQEHKLIVSALLDKEADKAVEILTRHLTRNYGSYFRQALDRQMAAVS